MTVEQLEEHVEFIDWSLVPSKLLTTKIKKLFGSLPQLKARIQFEKILPKISLKEDQKRYPGWHFFFIGNKYCMGLNLNDEILWCSEKFMFKIFGYNFKRSSFMLFLKNVLNQYIELDKLRDIRTFIPNNSPVESFFKNKKENLYIQTGEMSLEAKRHFKNKKS